ncbi:Quinone oxidoreductase-like protein [Hapsidospora chrysogenum ATCC 11550]|uniref:Quinone oxidoreductase-like protein n=1 Tax=Hapsidospora chrysogenum (strain ATCC 11550 / CBS 779.69 / DSM 880 / IAM 14645 / JCM 23072 / IMI 49137) TaxID=857340 RepID=A0A086SV90_HAPC1|nr:Quinone oxidoreductase-like protein [Hapsidospora chrysogenum ATCC 11550]
MKAVVVKEFYETLGDLHVSEVPKPSPKQNELLIKVLAAGVNFVDTLYVRGKHQNNRSLVRPPFTLGLEFAGLVVSAPSSSPYQPGDAVFGDHTGSYAEFLKLPLSAAASLQKIPQSWSPVDAAGLGATLPVSYGALAITGRLKAGETVLVHSAAGGLGIMAVQVAVALGCRVIGTAGSESKCDYARSFGASECFDYTKDDWWKRVLAATGGKGADVVFDPVGLVDLSLKCIAHRGRVLIVGFAGREGQMEKIAMNRVLLKQVNLIGYRYGESLRRYPEEKERLWSELRPLIESGKIRPTVFACYEGLESVPRALADLSNRKVSGKAVVKVSQDGIVHVKARL